MEESAVRQPEQWTNADYEAAIDLMLAEMERINASIEGRQAEIDRLKAETRAMLAQLRAAS